MNKGQLGLEALAVISAFLAFLLVLLYSFIGLNARASDFGEEMAARSCALKTAELAGYYYLDGLGSHFPLGIKDALGVGGYVHCKIGRHNASSRTLVIFYEKEPI